MHRAESIVSRQYAGVLMSLSLLKVGLRQIIAFKNVHVCYQT